MLPLPLSDYMYHCLTNLFVNSDIPEVKGFLQRYDGVGPIERIEAANTQSRFTNPSDFFKDCSHVPLVDYMTHKPDSISFMGYILSTTESPHGNRFKCNCR
uniref:uncharacterized protein LOC122602373 n=1 Tax=Erigeron canadensis TaxID=72917 RepID=UPI001CB8F8C7|nr:uncharacterized protein LOC122602373 [Erigeron canadensis]